MSFKTNSVSAWALTAALCVVPVVSIVAYGQEPAEKQQTREEEHEKKSKQDARADKETRHKSANETESRRGEKDHNARTADRKSANVHYHFRSQDRSKLREHFRAQLAHVDRAHRPHVAAGVTLEPTYQTIIEPVPQEVVVYLAPPPPGYEFGYLDGYVLVYDPTTFLVIDVIDLL